MRTAVKAQILQRIALKCAEILDLAADFCLNCGVRWKHLAPGGVPGSHDNFKAAEVMSFGGLNVFLAGANGGAYNAAAALLRHGAVVAAFLS